MSANFENDLQRRPLREVPQHWRTRILKNAQPDVPWWQAWLALWPKAWAGLGAAWIVILLLYVSTPQDAVVQSGGTTSFATLQQEHLMMAQLLGSSEMDEPSPALPAEPKPRSERIVKQLMG